MLRTGNGREKLTDKGESRIGDLLWKEDDDELLLLKIAQELRGYAENALAPNTARAQRADWEQFLIWCKARGRDALPASPVTVCLYIVETARTKKTSTIARYLSTISVVHKRTGFLSPTRDERVRTVWAGIKRTLGTAQEGKKPLLVETLRRMVNELPPTPAGVRDRALLLLGFAGAFRRSELVALNTTDLSWVDDGIIVTITRSKTDQEGEGRRIGIPYCGGLCPVRAVKAWVELLREEGPLFRGMTKGSSILKGRLSDRTVARIIKRTLERAGIPGEDFSGHSLRAGFATEAARGGASERVIQAQTGHQSLTVLRRYIREGELFRQNAVTFVRL